MACLHYKWVKNKNKKVLLSSELFQNLSSSEVYLSFMTETQIQSLPLAEVRVSYHGTFVKCVINTFMLIIS